MTSANSGVIGYRPHPGAIVAWIMLTAAATVGVASGADVYPFRWLATYFSDDGVLTAPYLGLLMDSQKTVAWSLFVAGCVVSWLPIGRWAQRGEQLPFRIVAGLSGLVAFGAAYLAQEWLFDGIPHVTDAISHLFQAKIFALGQMYSFAPDCPDAFWQTHILMTNTGKWFTKYTPGHALLLAGSMRLGLLKLLLPLCAAATIVVLGRLLQTYAGRAEARIFMVLFALSPLAILLGGSYMSHFTAMACASGGVALWLHSRAARFWTGAGACLAGSGFLLALSAMARPHEFLMLGLIGLLFQLTLGRSEWLRLFRDLPVLLLGAVPVLAFWMQFNLSIYENPFVLGYGYTIDHVIRPSCQGVFGFTDTFGPKEALSVLVWNFERFNHSFLGWPCSLIFVPFAFSRGRVRLLFLACAGIAVVVGTYFFYGWRTEYENRYYFLALPFFLYLTVRGMRNLVTFRNSIRWRETAARGVTSIIVAFSLYSALFYWPRYLLPKYHGNYEDCSVELGQAVAHEGVTNALVLLGPDDGTSFHYSSGFIHNTPGLDGDVIYARNLPKELACLRRSFPDRRFYRYDHTLEGPDRLVPFD